MTSSDVGPKLPDRAVLSIVEKAAALRPAVRAMIVLRQALPAEEHSNLDDWSVGRRDVNLLDIHVATFGNSVNGLATCPRCEAQLDVGFLVDDIRQSCGNLLERLVIDTLGYHVEFRLPSCADLMSAAACADTETARRLLVDRCVLAASHDQTSIPAATIPEGIIAEIGEVIAAHDPQSDIRLCMTCPSCGHAWEVGFDIADFLWREIAERARQLLVEVDTLARAYSWHEADILAMSEARRRAYLDLVLG